MKNYYTLDNVGGAKYTVSYHDGIQKHDDGSEFYDMGIFKTIASRNAFIDALKAQGYVERGNVIKPPAIVPSMEVEDVMHTISIPRHSVSDQLVLWFEQNELAEYEDKTLGEHLYNICDIDFGDEPLTGELMKEIKLIQRLAEANDAAYVRFIDHGMTIATEAPKTVKKPTIIVGIRDGQVDWVGSDQPKAVDLIVIDHDNLEGSSKPEQVDAELLPLAPEYCLPESVIKSVKAHYYPTQMPKKRFRRPKVKGV